MERNGSPIVVSVVVNYYVSDVARYVVRVEDAKVFLNMAEGVIREGCSAHALISDDPETTDIRRGGKAIAKDMETKLQGLVDTYGIGIKDMSIVEANYAPVIAQQMLMKQQAEAVIAARATLVAGGVHTVNPLDV